MHKLARLWGCLSLLGRAMRPSSGAGCCVCTLCALVYERRVAAAQSLALAHADVTEDTVFFAPWHAPKPVTLPLMKTFVSRQPEGLPACGMCQMGEAFSAGTVHEVGPLSQMPFARADA